MPAVADDGTVKWHANQDGRPAEGRLQAAPAQLERAIEADPHRLVEPGNLPRIAPLQPVVRPFLLPAVADRLAEDAVFVAQAVTHRRQLHGGHGIEEAGGETAEAAIAQAGIGLL